MLTQAIDDYLMLRRATGLQLRVDEYLLRDFARAAAGESHIRTATAITWASEAPSPGQRDRRLRVLVRFARHVHAEDPCHDVPSADVFATPRRRRVPHLFTTEEIGNIMAEAGRLGPAGSLRPHTYRTLFGLLVACGLRISEALALRLDDITVDGLVIRQSKFRKSRLVPMHPSTRLALSRYVRRRRKVAGGVPEVFVSLRGRPPRYGTVVATFLTVLRALGLRGAPGESGPHLHDLRHTFAVRSLENCPRDAVKQHLHALSTYMGHAKLADTYWYLRATPRLMRGIADACRDMMEI